jgi:DNA (cytosine-5)-methyltransferase 1
MLLARSQMSFRYSTEIECELLETQANPQLAQGQPEQASLAQKGLDRRCDLGVPNRESRVAEEENDPDSESLAMGKAKLQWYEFFAGGGMARLGLGDNWECRFSNEWSEKKAAAYRAYFGTSPELKVQDVRTLTPSDLPGLADLVWASFPCQDLSLAGSGAGLGGERSGTFTPFWGLMCRLIEEGRKPNLVVLENVVGAITSHEGRDFNTLLSKLSRSGYKVGPLVIDAVRFVPQSRPRLFIIAASNDQNIPSHFLSSNHDPAWHPASILKAYRNLNSSLRDSWVWWNLPEPHGVAVPTLSSIIEESPSGIEWGSGRDTARLISLMSSLNRRKLEMAQKEKIRKVGTIYKRTRPVKGNAEGKAVQRAELRFDGISGCLRTPVGGSSRQIVLVTAGNRIRSRLLSPREAARLMGVPESYPLPLRYNDAYHLFGDGVVVPVVAWIEKHLLRPLAALGKLKRVA